MLAERTQMITRIAVDLKRMYQIHRIEQGKYKSLTDWVLAACAAQYEKERLEARSVQIQPCCGREYQACKHKEDEQ